MNLEDEGKNKVHETKVYERIKNLKMNVLILIFLYQIQM
jgi:hypothetical protein